MLVSLFIKLLADHLSDLRVVAVVLVPETPSLPPVEPEFAVGGPFLPLAPTIRKPELVSSVGRSGEFLVAYWTRSKRKSGVGLD